MGLKVDDVSDQHQGLEHIAGTMKIRDGMNQNNRIGEWSLIEQWILGMVCIRTVEIRSGIHWNNRKRKWYSVIK